MPEAPHRGVVLVVDDSRVARAAVAARLYEAGIAAREAVCCADAVAAPLDQVNAALLDLELGDGTGVDLARTLRASHAELPIAFLTSAAGSRLASEARALGPVFEKGLELGDAVAWAAGCATR